MPHMADYFLRKSSTKSKIKLQKHWRLRTTTGQFVRKTGTLTDSVMGQRKLESDEMPLIDDDRIKYLIYIIKLLVYEIHCIHERGFGN